ncbi:hypothetical protein [Variovorax sp. YR750]|uniref:hypothetical protein n=1 Tax=Variovorax sp. YR750 TaxID=1884384 RepID=UPI001C4304B2|nr:hypothetical protein [Variovorax sp. YR750]
MTLASQNSLIQNVALTNYFDTDDGSLPEIEVIFDSASSIPVAFGHLYERGARNVTQGGGYLWISETQLEKPFTGPGDASLVASGIAAPFHVVLADIVGLKCPIPLLGVFVLADRLTIDYRMGADWATAQIESLLHLLRGLQCLGGRVEAPWWGEDGTRDLTAALDAI